MSLGPSKGRDYDCPLPIGGQDDAWKNSTIGIPSGWQTCLQAHVQTAASFSYPTAIFWGEQQVLLCNSAWFNSVSDIQQGSAQCGILKDDAGNAVNAALRGGQPRRIESKHFLEDGKDHVVLLSCLFGEGDESDKAVGVLAQLLTKPQSEREPSRDREGDQDDGGEHHVLDLSALGQVEEKVPLDQHPFFRRFAEMLPSGLAILDRTANAVFVNQQFYDLTTHQGDDQTFKSWPQSIHPDDHDRVLEAYRDAFDGRKRLRTEVHDCLISYRSSFPADECYSSEPRVTKIRGVYFSSPHWATRIWVTSACKNMVALSVAWSTLLPRRTSNSRSVTQQRKLGSEESSRKGS